MDKESLVKFSQEHPWYPARTPQMAKRLLNELTSSHDLIFDLTDGAGRAAAAVLIDRISNPCNDANLEVIGIRKDVDAQECIAKFIKLAAQRLPANKSGFMVEVRDGLGFTDDFFLRMGLSPHYATYKMENAAIAFKPVRRQLRRAERGDAKTVFSVLSASFAQNLETSIPDEESWTAKFGTSPRSHVSLCEEDGIATGFAHWMEPESGDSADIHNIGVLREHRGQSIGKDLLQNCLNEASQRGFKKAHLCVAAANESALSLYTSLGFHVTEKYQAYRKRNENR